MSSGGFAPRLKRESLNVGGEVEFLASEHMAVKRSGVTFRSDAVAKNADGLRIIKKGTFVTPDGEGYFVPFDGQTDEVQQVTVTGAPTGGTFTLTFDGETTDPIPFDAEPQEVEDFLAALSTIGDGNVDVQGPDGGPFVVRFIEDLADVNVATLTASGSGLTGGTTPGVTVSTTLAGGAAIGSATADDDESGYTLESYNVTDGDVIGGILIHGSVLAARVTPAPNATIRAAVKGRITFQ